MQQFPPIKVAIPTRVASWFDHPDSIFKVEAAMPKWSRRWPAKPVLVGLSPTATSIVQQRRQHISVEMIYKLADSAEALAKALRQGSSPSPTLSTVLT